MGDSDTSEVPAGDLVQPVAAFIDRHGMLTSGDVVVVGVSGGPDSVTLLDVLHRLREEWDLDIHVAHLDHRLRGPESDADAEFVASLAARLDLGYHGGAEDVAELSRREAYSLEEAARIARIGFLEKVRQQTGGNRIALGHTRSDQAETLLLRLLRGSGRRGLGAMQPVRDGVWVRPLMDTTRSQVEAYVSLRGLEARQDSSNRDTRFVRNRVRMDLLPHLERDYNPSIERILAQTAEVLQCEEELLDGLAQETLEKAVCHSGKWKLVLDASRVFGYHISIQRRVCRSALLALGGGPDALSYGTVERIVRLSGQPSGAVQVEAELSVHRGSNWLIFSRPVPDFRAPVALGGTTQVPALGATLRGRIRPAQEVRSRLRTFGPVRACFDLDRLEGQLLLRNRRPGDRFRPFGSLGTRKVSDFLIDTQVPRPLRDGIPLLLCGDTVAWVVGLRTAQPFSVTEHTRRVLDLSYEGGWVPPDRSRST
ncbi:MAG: tRNA lysidine(34) synthetase TilS [Candidatus Latescibacteria bacterium]|jgi:tRNA(Ile)-lysidine synthase|nr:tRNA lysidine(34) synthetase TilS [Candidatus Latescibacterota bacterium]